MLKKKTKIKKIRAPLPKQRPKIKTSAKVYNRKSVKGGNIKEAGD